METPRINYFKPVGLGGVELLSCPDAGFDFPPHFHQDYCIWFNTTGSEQYSRRGHTEILPPGSFGIVAPGDVHANWAVGHSARNLMTIYVQHALLQSVVRQIGTVTTASIEFQSRFYHDPESLKLLVRLFGILRTSLSTLEKESAFLDVFSLLVRRHGLTGTRESLIGNEATRVRGIIDLFRDRLAEDISLKDLARQFACTPYHLIRFFKKECGMSPHAYLVRLRLEHAGELIRRGRPLVDAALETGFSDQSHLTRLFKTHYGVTPGEFRRQILSV